MHVKRSRCKRDAVPTCERLLCDGQGYLLTDSHQYAMKQPEMCKFLVENGADIDELAPDPASLLYQHTYATILSQAYMLYCIYAESVLLG